MLSEIFVIGNVYTDSYEDAKDYVDVAFRMNEEPDDGFDYLNYIQPKFGLAKKERS